jgi:hypothetical protein
LNPSNTNKILYSSGKNDECLTPAYAVAPIIKYIPIGATVWCPFDTWDSEFVTQIIKERKVIISHLKYEKDFYTYEPSGRWDVIISNPPFTNKRKIFERALSFNKPFALMMSNTWFNDAAPKQLFEHKDLQLLMFDKRIQFDDQKKITFSTSYFCWNFLPKQIIMEKL